MTKVDELFEKVKLLPTNERELLATRILESLSTGDQVAIVLEPEDEAELHRRLDLIRTGQAKGHDLESVMAGLRAILRKQSVA